MEFEDMSEASTSAFARQWNISEEAAALHAEALIWDNHGCMPLRPDDEFLPQLQRYKDAGVNMAHLNIGYDPTGFEGHIRVVAAMRHYLLARPDEYVLALSVDEILRAKAEDKLAVGFDIEGAVAIQDQLSTIQLFYDLGVRWMSMAYNKTNKLGGGCHDKNDPGLTEFGRQALDEMARVGMVACCTHTGYRTAMDVFEYSKNPAIFSHSNPRALKDHERNVPDDLIRACAATGGVLCINGIGLFLGDNDTRTETIVRHIDHAVQTAGPEHVGIGLDYVFDAAELDAYLEKFKDTFPAGMGYDAGIKMVCPEQTPEITEGLLKLGYPEEAVRKVMGENMLRIARQVWK